MIRKTEESAFGAARAGNSMSLRLAKRHRVSPNASGAAGVGWGGIEGRGHMCPFVKSGH